MKNFVIQKSWPVKGLCGKCFICLRPRTLYPPPSHTVYLYLYTRGERQQFTKLGQKYQHVLLGSERMGPLSLIPTLWMFPLACTKSWLRASTLLLPDTQRRSYIIREWLYETFIVIEIVINRYVAVKTWDKTLITIFTQTQWLSINLKLLASTKYRRQYNIVVDKI